MTDFLLVDSLDCKRSLLWQHWPFGMDFRCFQVVVGTWAVLAPESHFLKEIFN